MYDKETGEDLSENYSKYLGDQIGYSSDEITTIHSYDISAMPTDDWDSDSIRDWSYAIEDLEEE